MTVGHRWNKEKVSVSEGQDTMIFKDDIFIPTDNKTPGCLTCKKLSPERQEALMWRIKHWVVQKNKTKEAHLGSNHGHWLRSMNRVCFWAPWPPPQPGRGSEFLGPTSFTLCVSSQHLIQLSRKNTTMEWVKLGSFLALVITSQFKFSPHNFQGRNLVYH